MLAQAKRALSLSPDPPPLQPGYFVSQVLILPGKHGGGGGGGKVSSEKTTREIRVQLRGRERWTAREEEVVEEEENSCCQRLP